MRFSKALFAILLATSVGCIGAESESVQAKAKILVLNMRLSAGQHQVRSARVVDSKRELIQRQADNDGIRYTVTDERGQLLTLGSMKDPRVLRGPLPPDGQGNTGHAVGMLDEVSYVLRVPYSANTRYLKFLPSQATARPSATASSNADTPTADTGNGGISSNGASQVIDLQQYLPSN